MGKYEKEHPQEGNKEAWGESLLDVFEGKQKGWPEGLSIYEVEEVRSGRW